jgi:hypothetical protein
MEQRAGAPDVDGFLPRLGQLTGMLIEERLYRDLREAEQVNAGLTGLARMVQSGELTAAQLAAVEQALGWAGRRVVDIVPIRPATELPGNAFAGFFDAGLRRAYLDIGYTRGLEVLGQRGWTQRPEARDRRRSVRHDDIVGVAADAVVLPRSIEGDRAE